eukprot:EST43008.1 Transmembrane domain-containing protein [Spironucleus salmonicida]
MLSVISKIIISHEKEFSLLSIYHDDIFVVANDIYTTAPIIKIVGFYGYIQGQSFIIDNIQLNTMVSNSEMFENFNGVLSNLALRYAIFNTVVVTNFYGVSKNIQGSIQNLTITAIVIMGGSTSQNYYLLGYTVFASIKRLWAQIELINTLHQQKLQASFAFQFNAHLADSTFKSSFSSDNLLNSQFYALCTLNNALFSSNITINTNFKNIYPLDQNISLITKLQKSSMSKYYIYANISLDNNQKDTLSKIFIISETITNGFVIYELLITCYIDMKTDIQTDVSLLPGRMDVQLLQSYIKVTLKLQFQQQGKFSLFMGNCNQLTIRNTSFISNITRLQNSNYSTIAWQLDNSIIEQCSFYIQCNINTDKNQYVYITGISNKAMNTNISCTNMYFYMFDEFQQKFIQVQPIFQEGRNGKIQLLSSYFFIKQTQDINSWQNFNGFIAYSDQMIIQNCIIVLNLTLNIGTSNKLCILSETAHQNNFENISIQVLAHVVYSYYSWAALGENISNCTYKNIVIYGDIKMNQNNYYQPITVLAVIIKNSIIQNMFMDYDVISPEVFSMDKLQFLILNDSGDTIINNFIYVGFYFNSTPLALYKPEGVHSGVRNSLQAYVMYSDQLNRYTYSSDNQVSIKLEHLKNQEFMKNIKMYNQKIWYYTPNVNKNLPRFDFVFQTSFWKFEAYSGFETSNTELISGKTTENHFQPKNGPNLCQMECQGKQSFWDQIPLCKYGFYGAFCAINCVDNPCLNGGSCSSGQCNCINGFSGQLCEIPHCIDCILGCQLVIGDTYQCGRSCIMGKSCIQGKCINDICVCNSNITSIPSNYAKCTNTNSCIFKKCDSFSVCIEDKCHCNPNTAIEINGICRQIAFPELGQCGIIDTRYECISCLKNKELPLCIDCKADSKIYNSTCYHKCNDCPGDCINISENKIHCFSCLQNLQIPDCILCITGYKKTDGICREITNTDKGDCWFKEKIIMCVKCYHNFNMPDCLTCPESKIEYNNSCYVRCQEKDCRGTNCFMITNTQAQCATCTLGYMMPQCRLCIPGYILIVTDCLALINTNKGICWKSSDSIMCRECYHNYEMPSCKICITGFVEKNLKCLATCPPDTCFGDNCLINEDGSYTCDVCYSGFVSPSCAKCQLGFILVNGVCQKSVNSDRGECYYVGIIIECNICFNGFNMPTCETCADGFKEISLKCIEICTVCKGIECLIKQNDDKICITCNTGYKMPSCVDCQDGFIQFEDNCHNRLPIPHGDCITKDGNAFCISCDLYYVTSIDNTQCLLECSWITCIFGICHPDQVCQCTGNVIGTKCDSCILGYGLISGYCYKIYENSKGDCFYRDDQSIFCVSCYAGFELSDDNAYCFQKCMASNCAHGKCVPGKGCLCYNGYSLEDGCLNYRCDFDLIKPCADLGRCINGSCKCYAENILILNTCYRCDNIVNGNCKYEGIICYKGWKGQKCDIFECRDDVNACKTTLFDNTCEGPQCSCAYPNQLYTGDCLEYCDLTQLILYTHVARTNIVHIAFETELVNLASILKKRPSGISVKDSCILGCLACEYIDRQFKCNPGVQFTKIHIAGSTLNTCSGCKPNYSGDRCQDCDTLSINKNGVCYLKCQNCNGDCYFNDYNNIECSSCYPTFSGPDCQICDLGYVMVGTDCLQKCETCNGDCYYKKGGVFCQNCTEGYDLASICQGCITGYHKYQEQCLRVCDTCDYGTCFYYQDTVVCSACHNGAELSQCQNCREGFVIYEKHCYPLIPGLDCILLEGEKICISCKYGELLIQKNCYPVCSLPFCINGLCYEAPEPICTSCYPDIQMQSNGSCLEITLHEGGSCTVDDQPICNCYEGYQGLLCEQCQNDTSLVEDRCFKDCSLTHETCFGNCQISFAFNHTKILCSECQVGYTPPDCKQCADGFKFDSNSECKLCDIGWINQSMLPAEVAYVLGEGCYKNCSFCEQGNCWFQGPVIKCAYCYPGYSADDNCQTCDINYEFIGGRCIQTEEISAGICGVYSEPVCISCKSGKNPLVCKNCLTGHIEYANQCYRPIYFLSGSCIMLENNQFKCLDEAVCLKGYYVGSQQYCTECGSYYILVNFTCWIQLQKYEMLYSGRCYLNVATEVVKCIQCDAAFIGIYCDQCKQNYIQCRDYQCCQIAEEKIKTGICYKEIDGSYFCNTCATGFYMVQSLCIGHIPNKFIYLWFLLPLIVLTIIILIVSIGKSPKLMIFRHKIRSNVNRLIYDFFKITCGIFLCQIIALCVALQDTYVDDIHLYSASLSIGSFPFAFLLFFLEPPNLGMFYYHKISDFFMFLFGAGLDFMFQLTVYKLLPQAMSVSQTIFKCFSAPFSMLLFTFILKMKYKFSQMILLFAAVSLPLYFALKNAFNDVFDNPYQLNEESILSIIVAIFQTMFAILCEAFQILFLQNILGAYSEVQVMMRLGFAFFLIYFLHTLLSFKEIIDSVSSQQNNLIIAVVLVVVMNVLMPVTLIFISPLAVTFNMVTSAVWVEIINSLSIGVLQGQNLYPVDIYPVTFCCVMFLAVFFTLVIYYYIMDYQFEKFNQDINSKKEKKSFIPSFLALKQKQRHAYKAMNGIKTIKLNQLKTFVKKSTIQSKEPQNTIKDFVCVDIKTGQQIAFKQPRIHNSVGQYNLPTNQQNTPPIPHYPQINIPKANQTIQLSTTTEGSDSFLIDNDS